MDKIQKILGKLTAKEREAFLLVMEQIQRDYTKVPNLSSLKGKKGWFKVRIGRYRIIFLKTKDSLEIRRITKRDENTYKNL